MKKAILLGLVLAPLSIDAGHGADRGTTDDVEKASISLPADWSETLTIDGFLDGGVALNPALPANGLNFGQYYTDRANSPQLTLCGELAGSTVWRPSRGWHSTVSTSRQRQRWSRGSAA